MASITFPIVLYPNLPLDRKVQLLLRRNPWQVLSVLLVCFLSIAIAIFGLWSKNSWLGFVIFFVPVMLIWGWRWLEGNFHPQEYRDLWKYLRPQMPSAKIAEDRRGFGEFPENALFPTLLQKSFPQRIITLRKVAHYIPDFIYLDQSHNLHIDIEIDEPYTPRQYPAEAPLQLTHCQGQDDVRNRFFQSAQWFVVRFSERQVLLHPESCLKFLIELINQLTGEGIPNPFVHVPDLEPEPQWTKDMAESMANRQVRLHYDRDAQR